MTQNNNLTSAGSYKSATGSIRYNFMNDVMFKISFQKQQVLSKFLCALLRLSLEDIQEIKVNNTFIPGNFVDQKTFLLDIDLTLNKKRQINIELQIIDRGDWTDRSLQYLCRNYNNLQHGDDYSQTKQALHISILNFTLFSQYPEFYAHYRLMHSEKHYIYNSNFQLNVLDLTQINLATHEDKIYQLDQWAALFKVTTWEEIRVMAENNEIFDTLAEELYKSNSNDMIRRICEKREDDARQERRLLKRAEDAEAEVAVLKAKIAELETAANTK